MNLLNAIILTYAALVIFYTLYIAAVQVYYAWDSLAPWVRVLAFLPVVIMLMFDTMMQCTLFTLFFWDVPQEPLVTQRLSRYRDEPTDKYGWRKTLATAICTQALNPFDPTKKHC